jgi:hypothetical protein
MRMSRSGDEKLRKKLKAGRGQPRPVVTRPHGVTVIAAFAVRVNPMVCLCNFSIRIGASS